VPDDPSPRRLTRPLFDAKPEAEVDEEIAFHLEQRIRDYVAQGMDPVAARAAALERFGADVTDVKRVCTDLLAEERRATTRRMWVDDFVHDLRFGLRSARRAPCPHSGSRNLRPLGAPRSRPRW